MAVNLTSFRMFLATCTGNAQNNTYRNAVMITSGEELAAACRKDHVCVAFEECRRSNKSYIRGYAFAADCDNDYTENPAAWITPETIAAQLPGVAFYAVKSRNCDKVKHPGEPGEKSARPRWHYYFPLRVPVEGYTAARKLTDMFLYSFPMFDEDGTKPAQFFFGHAEPVAEYHPGEKDIAEYFRENPIEMEPEPEEDSAEEPRQDVTISDDFAALNVEDMLSHISARCDYRTWYKIGMAIKSADLPFEIWDSWSRTAPDLYPGVEKMRRKWISFKGGRITFGTIVHMAKENGWIADPDKLTGEAKANHEAAEAHKEELNRYREEHREEHRAALAAVGINTDDPYLYTWKLDFDGSFDEVIKKESGEIVYRKTDEQRAASRAAGDSMRPVAEDIQGIKVNKADPAAAAPAISPADPAAPWEPIKKGKSLPLFPLEILPEWLKDYVDNFVENTGISKDFCAACIFGAVSSVICGRLRVHFNGTHYEPAQLYTVFVARSGSMKSTAKKEFVGPAITWLMEKNKAAKAANKDITDEIDILLDELQKEQRKKSGQDEKRITELKAQIEHKQEKQAALYPVPFTDVVPESITKSMTKTNGIASIAAAEGNIINVLTGRSYTQRGAAPNLDIFLAGYDGEPYHGIRVTSGEIDIPSANISILIAVQPMLLETLCRSSDANGRGLVQRFLIFAPEEPGISIDHTRPSTSDPQHMSRWNDHIRTIAERFMRPNDSPVVMELCKDADTQIRQLWNDEDAMIRERGPADEEGITGWISKLHGKALRLAATLAILDEPKANNITKEPAEKAVKLLKEYFLPHYLNAFESEDTLTREERQIVGWITRRAIRTGQRKTFTEREIWNYLRQLSSYSGKYGKEKLCAALDGLQDKNIIRPLAADKTRSGTGRPAKAWQINPEIFTK